MQKRGARLALVALLLAVGGAAATLSFDIDRRARALDDGAREIARQIDTLIAATVEIGLAQHGYVALGQADPPPEEVVASLLQRVDDGVGTLRAAVISPEAGAVLDAVVREMAQLAEVDRRAHAYARQGQTFLASDLLFGSARQRLASAGAQLRDLRSAETAALERQRDVLRRERWSALGAGAAVWAIGLLLLAWPRRTSRPSSPEPATASSPDVPASGAAPSADSPPGAQPPALDLTGAAALCNDLCRVTTTAALPDLLGRAAGILDARGLIIWMGAGDQLFAASAYGYDARIVNRLAPMSRTAQNATATAWRTGRVATVKAQAGVNGAIVAPMFDPSRCIGVLAAEVRHGREDDPATRALTAIVAAQLSAIVAAWPATSSVEGDAAGRDRAAG